MNSLIAFTCIIATVSAFKASGLRSSPVAMKMSAEGITGSLEPMGFFDPLNLSMDKSDRDIKKFREAELKHGRVAMVAFVGMLTGESFNPLFEGKISGPAIYQFQQADELIPYFWVGVLFSIALVEVQNILTGWESPAETAEARGGSEIKGAGLKESYINGDLGFDPLSLKPTDADEFNVLRTKELQNGRLAMLGVAGIVAQELVNGKGVLENLGF